MNFITVMMTTGPDKFQFPGSPSKDLRKGRVSLHNKPRCRAIPATEKWCNSIFLFRCSIAMLYYGIRYIIMFNYIRNPERSWYLWVELVDVRWYVKYHWMGLKEEIHSLQGLFSENPKGVIKSSVNTLNYCETIAVSLFFSKIPGSVGY